MLIVNTVLHSPQSNISVEPSVAKLMRCTSMTAILSFAMIFALIDNVLFICTNIVISNSAYRGKLPNLDLLLDWTTVFLEKQKYEGKSIIIRNAAVFVFLLAALSFCAASPCVVSLSLFQRRFDVARSVPSSLPCR
jgi:hypothetical protein